MTLHSKALFKGGGWQVFRDGLLR